MCLWKMGKSGFPVNVYSSVKFLRLLNPIITSKCSAGVCHELANSDVKSEKTCESDFNYSNVNFDETNYYFQDGIRKVYPYYFTHSMLCKRRWIRKKLADIYTSEFVPTTTESVVESIVNGRIRVNGRIVLPDYILKDGDLMTNVVHRHELAVLAAPVKIVRNDEDVVVVEKPPSVPVHPGGMFRYNSIMFILAKEHNLKGLHVVNRLDRLASGVLVFAKSKEKSQELNKEMTLQKIHKEYVCRVEGRFPDGIITCSKPLRIAKEKISVTFVGHTGKDSVTKFERISYNGKSSVVICRPLTGRTHQIRAHLQYLGYPIVNDPLYNSYNFGPGKGKGVSTGKPIKKVLQDLFDSRISNSVQNPENVVDNVQTIINSYCNTPEYHELAKFYIVDENLFQLDAKCKYCNSSFKDPVLHSDMFICLHAIRYRGKGWDYRTEMPEWAKADWNVL